MKLKTSAYVKTSDSIAKAMVEMWCKVEASRVKTWFIDQILNPKLASSPIIADSNSTLQLSPHCLGHNMSLVMPSLDIFCTSCSALACPGPVLTWIHQLQSQLGQSLSYLVASSHTFSSLPGSCHAMPWSKKHQCINRHCYLLLILDSS